MTPFRPSGKSRFAAAFCLALACAAGMPTAITPLPPFGGRLLGYVRPPVPRRGTWKRGQRRA